MNCTPTLPFALLLAVLGCACSSTPEKPQAEGDEVPTPLARPVDEPLGKFLVDLDGAIARWGALSMSAKSVAEQRQARLLEQLLVERTTKRQAELIKELESGPPINRVRAATALGFTHSVEAQSPLLNALHDPSPDVVHNALLGLAILARADTPLEEICRIAEDSIDPQTRSQAAYAMRSIVGAGADATAALPTARRGLVSDEPFVRSQCALTLGIAGDKSSVQALTDLLADATPLVAHSAIKALVLVAKKDPSQKGAAARALLACHASSKGELSDRALEGLLEISDANYGSDLKQWTEWAERLP